jgi:two-component system chemotaxis response regulator CheB
VRKTTPTCRSSSSARLTERGGAKTLDALSAGAADYVTKRRACATSMTPSVRSVSSSPPKVVTLHEAAVARAGPAPPDGTPGRARAGPPRRRAPSGGRVEVVALGCSTGGPEALAAIVPRLPGDLAVPILVVQHMPRLFTRLLAQRLDRLGGLRVIEAAGDEPLEPGHVYIAPGERHLEVVRDAAGVPRTRLSTAPPENNCRPAVDVLFRSVAQEYGGAALGVVLTGMGSDGRRGSEALVGTGSRVIVQDEAKLVVWGLPSAARTAGLATRSWGRSTPSPPPCSTGRPGRSQGRADERRGPTTTPTSPSWSRRSGVMLGTDKHTSSIPALARARDLGSRAVGSSSRGPEPTRRHRRWRPGGRRPCHSRRRRSFAASPPVQTPARLRAVRR